MAFTYNDVTLKYGDPSATYGGVLVDDYPGSTLRSELNRLANGGTYPLLTAYLAEKGAANKWAGVSGYEVQGALNRKAGKTDPSTFLDIQAVCSLLAGTPKTMTAIDSLRSIPF